MNINEDYPADIIPIHPQGINSTMFTSCCGTAICADELNCPNCKRKVIGWDAETEHDRGRIRWQNATAHWKRRK